MTYFTYVELKCPCCGQAKMEPGFMAKLNKLREVCDFSFTITSAYRCEKHNKEIGGEPNSAHVLGRAVDIQVSGTLAYRLLALAPDFGMTGLGIKQHGPHEKRFIHLDDTTGATRPWVWTYA